MNKRGQTRRNRESKKQKRIQVMVDQSGEGSAHTASKAYSQLFEKLYPQLGWSSHVPAPIDVNFIQPTLQNNPYKAYANPAMYSAFMSGPGMSTATIMPTEGGDEEAGEGEATEEKPFDGTAPVWNPFLFQRLVDENNEAVMAAHGAKPSRKKKQGRSNIHGSAKRKAGVHKSASSSVPSSSSSVTAAGAGDTASGDDEEEGSNRTPKKAKLTSP